MLQLAAERERRLDQSGEMNHAVDAVHAARGHGAGGAFGLVGAPVARLGLVARGAGKLAFDMAQLADLAGGETPLKFEIGRGVAAIEADMQRHVRGLAGVDGGLRVFLGQCERFFAENMLAGFGGGDDFLGVLRMRRRQHDAVDILVGENVVITRGQSEAVFFGEVPFARRVARDRGGEADLLALVVNRLDEPRSPVTGTRNRHAQHGVPSTFTTEPQRPHRR